MDVRGAWWDSVLNVCKIKRYFDSIVCVCIYIFALMRLVKILGGNSNFVTLAKR